MSGDVYDEIDHSFIGALSYSSGLENWSSASQFIGRFSRILIEESESTVGKLQQSGSVRDRIQSSTPSNQLFHFIAFKPMKEVLVK